MKLNVESSFHFSKFNNGFLPFDVLCSLTKSQRVVLIHIQEFGTAFPFGFPCRYACFCLCVGERKSVSSMHFFLSIQKKMRSPRGITLGAKIAELYLPVGAQNWTFFGGDSLSWMCVFCSRSIVRNQTTEWRLARAYGWLATCCRSCVHNTTQFGSLLSPPVGFCEENNIGPLVE